MKTLKWLLWGACALVSQLALADADAVRKLLETRVPRLVGHVQNVAPAHVLGLYEIYTDDRQILYTDEGVTVLIAGDILDAKTLKNITEARMKVLGAIRPETLPLELAMKKVKGNGKRTLVVFSDPDCPYCRKLEKELTGITDVTIYTFVYPIASLHPQAPDHSRWIWCSADRQKTWDNYLLRNVMPAQKDCATPLDTIQALGAKYRINGTPTLIFADGEVVPGVMPKDDLDKALGPR
jgi:thiol:disulfide interchange protein DsbC